MQKTLAVINLQNIAKNARFVRSLAGKRKFYAVVKADAYGHGAPQVARRIESFVDGFCVAITDEAVALRVAGITKPILVFTPPLGRDDVLRARHYGLTVTVNSVKTAGLIGDLPCHIKVNTGMNRTGCDLNELEGILKILSPYRAEGVYSHLYAPQDGLASKAQLEIFNRAEEAVKSYFPSAIAHISASGGLLRGGEYLKDGVRAGILLYGYAPSGFSAEVCPAMRVFARRVQTTRFIGGGCGYAPAKKNYSLLHTYRAGYADGFFRGVPLGEGNLCMDAFISQREGDMQEVLPDVAAYAAAAGTISYEVLCSATRRAERIYV